MESAHRFGGVWTDKKLDALSDYLTQYRRIMIGNEKARFFKTVYLDGFAGTGERQNATAQASEDQLSLTPEWDVEIQQYKRGSAAVALKLASPFDQYIFVDASGKHAAELSALIRRDFSKAKGQAQWQRVHRLNRRGTANLISRSIREGGKQ